MATTQGTIEHRAEQTMKTLSDPDSVNITECLVIIPEGRSLVGSVQFQGTFAAGYSLKVIFEYSLRERYQASRSNETFNEFMEIDLDDDDRSYITNDAGMQTLLPFYTGPVLLAEQNGKRLPGYGKPHSVREWSMEDGMIKLVDRKEIWNSKDGKRQLISNMADTHLWNTIRLLEKLRKLEGSDEHSQYQTLVAEAAKRGLCVETPIEIQSMRKLTRALRRRKKSKING